MVQPDRTRDNIIPRMRFACCISKVTNTHSEYVILIALTRQKKWLLSPSILHFACIVQYSCSQSTLMTDCAYSCTQRCPYFPSAHLRFSFDFPPRHDSQMVTVFPVRRLCTRLAHVWLCITASHSHPPVFSVCDPRVRHLNWNTQSFTFVVALSTAAVTGYVGECRPSVR